MVVKTKIDRIPVDKKKDKWFLKNNPTFLENGGGIINTAGMYGGRVVGIANVFWVVAHLTFLMYTIYHSIVIDFDLGLFSGTIHYVLMTTSASSTIVNSQIKKKILEMIIIQLENFHEYGDTMDPESQEEILKEKTIMKTRKTKVSRLFFVLFVMAGILSMAVFPLIFQTDKTVKDDYIHRNLPVKVWYPLIRTIDVSWPAWIWMLFCEYWIAYIILGGAMGTDIPFACFTEEGTFQMKVLAIGLRNTVRRAKFVLKNREIRTSKRDKQNQLGACIKECLNHSVIHHHEIIQFFNYVRDLNYFILLIVMLGSTFLLCLSGLIFVSDAVQTIEKLQFLIYLIVVIFHIFVFNWYGEMVSEVSLQIGEELYEADWQQYSSEMKQHVLIMQSFLQKPINLTAGGFMEINLNTFGNVLSSSYSYFNLLTVMMARGEGDELVQ